MARAIRRRSSVDPKVFRHFAAGTLVVTLLLALFTQDDGRSVQPAQLSDRPSKPLANLGEGRITPIFKSMPTAGGGWGSDSASYGAPMNNLPAGGMLAAETLAAEHDPELLGDDPDFIPTEEELLMLGLTLDQYRALAVNQRIAIIRKLTRRRQQSLMAASVARSRNDAAYRDLLL